MNLELGTEKLEWRDYPIVKKWRYDYPVLVSTEYTNVTDKQTVDGLTARETAHDGIGTMAHNWQPSPKPARTTPTPQPHHNHSTLTLNGCGVGVVSVWCGCGVVVVSVWLWYGCGVGVVVVRAGLGEGCHLWATVYVTRLTWDYALHRGLLPNLFKPHDRPGIWFGSENKLSYWWDSSRCDKISGSSNHKCSRVVLSKWLN